MKTSVDKLKKKLKKVTTHQRIDLEEMTLSELSTQIRQLIKVYGGNSVVEREVDYDKMEDFVVYTFREETESEAMVRIALEEAIVRSQRVSKESQYKVLKRELGYE